jgi:hypothetical protein
MKITAYKCENTGAIFEHYKDYAAHRKRYLAEQAKRAAQQARIKGADAAFENLRLTAVDFDTIAAWVVDNQQTLIDRYNAQRNGQPRKLRKNEKPFAITSVVFDNMRRDSHISNSHNAPLGQLTNWGRSFSDRPTSYPGHRGTIRICYEGEFSGSITDLLKGTGICTGSGGGGAGKLNYETILWADDWPGMKVYDLLTW